MKTKHLVYSLGLFLSLNAAGLAGSLQPDQVSAEAKWLLHCDLERFHDTKVGQYLGQQILDKKWEKPKGDLKNFFDLDLDWRSFESMTAYGTDFQAKNKANAVLIIKTDRRARENLAVALRQQVQKSKETGGPVALAQESPFTLYSINNDVFISLQKGNLVLLSKSRPMIQMAGEVLAGKAANLTAGQALAGFPEAPKAFFFLAVAEGFNQPSALPPQARVLQQADGARLVLGENNDRLFLNLALKAKTPEIGQQMQQVVQGIISLVTLSQPPNPDVQALAQSAKVSAQEKLVTVDVGYPVSRAIEKIDKAARK
jgi:hypothetical protein